MSLALEQIAHPALCEYVNMYSNRLNILSSWGLWVSLVVLCPALYYVKAHNLPLGYLSFFSYGPLFSSPRLATHVPPPEQSLLLYLTIK
jgi:uncharacterized membrane protein